MIAESASTACPCGYPANQFRSLGGLRHSLGGLLHRLCSLEACFIAPDMGRSSAADSLDNSSRLPRNLHLPRVVPFSHAPGVKGNVRRGAGDVLVENAPYSRIFHAAVVDADGRFLYDLPALAEPAGAVALAVDPSLRVGLLRQWRPVPARAPPGDDALDFAAGAAPRPRGFWSVEVPRGFPAPDEPPAAAARREAEEELGVRVSRAVPLGHCNFNTSLLLTDIPLFAVLAHPAEPSTALRDPAERIDAVRWLCPEDALALVAAGEIRCGLTMAALAHLVASRRKLEELVRA